MINRGSCGRLTALVALLGLTACSTSTSGRPAKSEVPSRAYDVRVFLCPVDFRGIENCPGPATARETAGVWNRLMADDRIENFLYLSSPDAYRLAKFVVPAAAQLGPSALPATFLLQLGDSVNDGRGVLDGYRHAAGVQTVTACSATGLSAKLCDVRTLRAAGVLN